MASFIVLWRKSVKTLRTSGIRGFAKKVIAYVEKIQRLEDNSRKPGEVFMDVLFINGCYLPHPARYRVAHQREQLLANGIKSNEVLFENVTLDLVKRYRLFIFFRCPYTDTIGEFIKLAKQHHKTVLFDVDDLVIDRKYTDQIKFVQSMSPEDKRDYDSGVDRMHQTLRLCDGAITTTRRLAEELKNYVPEVYINRNVASDKMIMLSDAAVYERDTLPRTPLEKANSRKERRRILELREKYQKRIESGEVTIGYFSGSITHNDDIKMVLPVLVRLMSKYDLLRLCFVGELDLPAELEPFRARISALPFVHWTKLPGLVAGVDINIAPIEDTIFNEAKSENKWTEAALVKVPTVASRVGAFKDVIEDGKTGLLCGTEDEWFDAISRLIEQPELRRQIGERAYQTVQSGWYTVFSGKGLSDYLRGKMTENLVMILPSLQLGGGMLVALKHCEMLMDAGLDVTVFNAEVEEKDITYDDRRFFVISVKQTRICASIDRAVATLWETMEFLELYPNIRRRYYLVQGFEPSFYKPGNYRRIDANRTYSQPIPLKYVTVSKWCRSWLADRYGQTAEYAPNGIDLKRFPVRRREISGGRIRILVEGNCDDDFKNVDESFRIVEKLDSGKFEIWYMSYQGRPKHWYRVDRFLHQVPNEKVGEVYSQCDILLKSSILESFSYPPLEMMATGGYVVVAPNDGNMEYLCDRVNCLLYERGSIDSAVEAIRNLEADPNLRETLFRKGRETAQQRDWNNQKREILSLYDVEA